MDIEAFVNMTSRAWAVPILAAMHSGVAGRQAPLLAATGAGRSSFGQSLEHLLAIGLMERNPGYGHPLRPEFRLTQRGVRAAAVAYRVQEATSRDDQKLLRRSWTLPVLVAVHRPQHFNDIRRGLHTITDRALSQSLRLMEEKSWVCRRVELETRQPRPVYHAVNTGQVISSIAASAITFS